jgi:hypothetical protein
VKPAQVVTHVRERVGGAEQAGDEGTKTPVVEAGDGGYWRLTACASRAAFELGRGGVGGWWLAAAQAPVLSRRQAVR